MAQLHSSRVSRVLPHNDAQGCLELISGESDRVEEMANRRLVAIAQHEPSAPLLKSAEPRPRGLLRVAFFSVVSVELGHE